MEQAVKNVLIRFGVTPFGSHDWEFSWKLDDKTFMKCLRCGYIRIVGGPEVEIYCNEKL